MLLQRATPLATFGQLRHELDRFFSDSLPEINGRWASRQANPSLNIREDAEQFIVDMEVPGLKMEDLSVEVVGNQLMVAGKWSVGAEDDKSNYLRCERASGEFSRTVTLPTEINTAKAQAVLKDGVMTITLPKADVAKATKILVKAK